MAQHYLLSSQSKQLSIKQICRLTDEQAFQMLKVHRWGNPDDINDVCCPFCGILLDVPAENKDEWVW